MIFYNKNKSNLSYYLYRQQWNDKMVLILQQIGSDFQHTIVSNRLLPNTVGPAVTLLAALKHFLSKSGPNPAYYY